MPAASERRRTGSPRRPPEPAPATRGAGTPAWPAEKSTAWRGAQKPETLEQSSGAALERSGRNSFSSFSELSQRRWGPRPIDSIHSEASARPRHVACRRDSTRPVSGSKRFSFKAPTDTASQPEAAEHVNLQRAERRSNPSPSDRLQTANRADTRRRPQTPSPLPAERPRPSCSRAVSSSPPARRCPKPVSQDFHLGRDSAGPKRVSRDSFCRKAAFLGCSFCRARASSACDAAVATMSSESAL